ncbi:hypothetical protein DYBT9275_01588 [Dyadobacter sp. CECT 9275]|uniref:Endonuclease/exonuclease/phosphatase domain-containing protein n=1 Tax=Dyadobacter helix TaxID=2822344 RepID=A0A916N560_9BACT|nr:endonuclease/exonuclease/phosphatase family protein [Dyadobacter sp. CECT 9275]CAG4995241.1 hypothetical protein DYBT9275_01588 [Dyadobacter sp. CECT 9275]
MNTLKLLLRFSYVAYAVFTLILILITFFGFNASWIAGFLGLSLPVILLSHVPVFLLYLFFDIKRIGWCLLVLAGSAILLPRTYVSGSEDGATVPAASQVVRLLNYNVRNMNTGSENDASKDEIRNWLVNAPVDIMVLPEYFSNISYKRFQINTLLQRKGFKYYHSLRHENNLKTGRFHGLILFSKFPVITAKDTVFEDLNGIILADIKVREDTVTIIGVHLYSMMLRLDELLNQRKRSEITREGKESYYRIRDGFVNRKRETDLMLAWIRASRHPVIVCGDFNETPYSYSYSQTRRLLSNAFEDKGKGFGFTFNGTPSFIRIDNQFYDDERLELVSFQTLTDVKHSDHYPLIGVYVIKKPDRK